ncbi:MAG TPA: Rrf2 family transcriptional regulator [Vicinamibacteria bacterium]|nr:Rrf2 family transcriptional regulator [Vicinamibacteria bacterium]
MLKLSKKVDYALIALMHLARQDSGSSLSAREIASGYGLPPDLLAKVLQRLAREGIVESHQGIKGGYSLKTAASRIDVVRVIEAIDGPLTITQCISDLGTCEQFDTCNVKSPLQRLGDEVLRTLKRVTIADLCAQDYIYRGADPEVQLPVIQH